MRNRSRAKSSPVDGLRLAVECLPVATREAMLEGVRRNERIIAGAYVDEYGGVCPMLAAHRCGGRTDFLSFAKSWDRFARAQASRRATERELRILTTQLEESLLESSGLELDRAIAEHRALCLRSRALKRARRLPDEGDPRGEIIARRLLSRRRKTAAPDAQRSVAADARVPVAG
jgi:hypothetical protein